MKHLLLAISMTVTALSLSLSPTDADAKRLGADKPAGMQRAAPDKPGAPAHNAAPAAAPAAPAAPAATPPKRSWMGPLAGLAAGIGIAALFSHLGMGAGMGEAMGNILMMLLVAGVAFFAIRFVMSRMGGSRGGPQLAGAGAPAPTNWQPTPNPEPVAMARTAFDTAPQAQSLAAVGTVAALPVLPGGMAAADFERLAKMVFTRMQAANDAANLDDLRKFTTPELFASLRTDLQDRGNAKQQTDVVQIDAQVIEAVVENGNDIVTVRFHGLIREAVDAGVEPFNEHWHLVRPADGKSEWAIAGITPVR